jgi:hypothetical protein
VQLSGDDEAKLAGEAGPGTQLAMKLVVAAATWIDAGSLLDIEMAHIDGCLYHGPAGLDFVTRLSQLDARVAVPTTLNVTSLDLLHPGLHLGDEEEARRARMQMEAYEHLGCRPTWTCAPYQLATRPGFGQQIAWGESNAIVFANSVLGARTERYGDFLDVACAITGRAPAGGLHLDEHRVATAVVELVDVAVDDMLFPVLGHWLGRFAGSEVVAVVGIEAATEDQLKALGAAAASSGAVGLFHVVGVTPEAPSLAAALGDAPPRRHVRVGRDELRLARADLATLADGPLGAVSVGTPHYSTRQLTAFADELAGREVAVPCYVSAGRDTLAESAPVTAALERSGVQLVTDTCTYFTPIMRKPRGCVLTDSAKWAYYAPGNLGVDVAFGSMEECVESAVSGRLETRRWPP